MPKEKKLSLQFTPASRKSALKNKQNLLCIWNVTVKKIVWKDSKIDRFLKTMGIEGLLLKKGYLANR